MTRRRATSRPLDVVARRLPVNPIVVPEMDERIGTNVNGPSLIRAPEWLPERLGTYYLYFAHHEGASIRLAVADELVGPWRVHSPNVLDVSRAFFIDHIASPDVHVDEERREIRMYYHGLLAHTGRPQGTRVAISGDGVRFRALQPLLAPRPYLRAFAWAGGIYATTMSGVFWRSPDGLAPFEHMPWPGGRLPTFLEGLELDRAGRWPGPLPFRCRHVAVQQYGERLLVVYSMAGERPERLVYSWVDLRPDWTDWTGTAPRDLLKPEMPWEGADLPLVASAFGAIHRRVRQLRDPAIFVDRDGLSFLIYSIAGESGLAIAELGVNP